MPKAMTSIGTMTTPPPSPVRAPRKPARNDPSATSAVKASTFTPASPRPATHTCRGCIAERGSDSRSTTLLRDRRANPLQLLLLHDRPHHAEADEVRVPQPPQALRPIGIDPVPARRGPLASGAATVRRR